MSYFDRAHNTQLVSSDLIDQVAVENLKRNLYNYYAQIQFLNDYSQQACVMTNNLMNELAQYYTVFPVDSADNQYISNFSGAIETEVTTSYDLTAFRVNKSLNPKLYDMIDIHLDRLGGLEIVMGLSRKILDDINVQIWD